MRFWSLLFIKRHPTAGRNWPLILKLAQIEERIALRRAQDSLGW